MNRKDTKNTKRARSPVKMLGEPRSRYEYALNDSYKAPGDEAQGLPHALPDAIVEDWAKVVVNAANIVSRTLGPGFLESVYEEALCLELQACDIPFARQASISVRYRGQIVGEGRVDLLIGERLIVELKAVDALLPIHTAQVISYLKATREQLGVLINFKAPVFKQAIKRVIYS